MDFRLTEAHLALKRSLEEFTAAEIVPRSRELEEAEAFPSEIMRQLSRRGLLTMCVPKAAGGTYTDSVAYSLAITAVAKADAGVSVPMSVTNMFCESVYKFGTDAQRERYLSRFASGDFTVGAFALTENMAGSDAAAMKTTALPDPTDPAWYVLEGEKVFISSADAADVFVVFAKTDPAAGGRGVSAFLVDAGTKGLVLGKKEEKMGIRSSTTLTLLCEGLRVHRDQLLSKVGDGFKIAMSALDSGRIGIASQAVGLGEATYEACLKRVKTGTLDGQPMAKLQGYQFALAEMYVKLSAARLMTLQAAVLKDQGVPFTLEASAAKLYATETVNEMVSDAVRLHGQAGVTTEGLVEKYFRDARVNRIYEGTSEIQKLVIARKLLGA